MADLVSDVLARGRTAPGALPAPAPGRRVGGGATPSYDVVGEGAGAEVRAVVDGTVVGLARLRPESEEAGVHEVVLRVDPAWQRRGIGTRLLTEVCRTAAASGASSVVLTTSADNQAVLPMVLAAGLRGRIRMAADTLTVRIPVREMVRSAAG